MKVAVIALISISALFQATPKPAETTPVIGHGVGAVPGTLICPDMPSLDAAFDMYADYYETSMRAVLTHSQSTLVDGKAVKPKPEAFRCVLVSPGSHMELEKGNIVPVIRAKLPNGHTVRGVTLPSMYSEPEKQRTVEVPDTKSMASQAAKDAPDISAKSEPDRVVLMAPNGPCAFITREGSLYHLKAFSDAIYQDYYLAMVNGYQQCEASYHMGTAYFQGNN